jgi:SAM-dependent methyltransferase
VASEIGTEQGGNGNLTTTALERVLDGSAADATARFCGIVRMVDADARHAGRVEPTNEETQRVGSEFRRMVDSLDTNLALARTNVVVRQRVRSLVVPWLLRSRFWCRTLLKPRSFAGDFQLLEWVYELERRSGPDLSQTAVANILDEVYASLEGVRAVWYRRAWARDLIVSTAARLERPVRVLDVGSGGSRYTRDALRLRPGAFRLAAVDEDPAAIAFLRAEVPADALDRVGLLCLPLVDVSETVPVPSWPEAGFDVVLVTSALDDLDDGHAAALVAHLAGLTRPGGVTAVCNSSPDDSMRALRAWITDTTMHYRDEAAVRELFPPDRRDDVSISISPDGALVCTQLRR